MPYLNDAETREMVLAMARAQATAYVWGRQDAGERNTGYSLDFGRAYEEHVSKHELGEVTHRMGIERAFLEWRDNKTIGGQS